MHSVPREGGLQWPGVRESATEYQQILDSEGCLGLGRWRKKKHAREREEKEKVLEMSTWCVMGGAGS
jgi:hypothetical protein